MSHVCIRFYVGHESKTATAEAIAQTIVALREDCAFNWGGSTATEGEGLFQGKAGFYRERCTIVETVVEISTNPGAPVEKGEKHVRLTARHMAKACAMAAGQECVMVTFQPVEAVFVSADRYVSSTGLTVLD